MTIEDGMMLFGFFLIALGIGDLIVYYYRKYKLGIDHRIDK